MIDLVLNFICGFVGGAVGEFISEALVISRFVNYKISLVNSHERARTSIAILMLIYVVLLPIGLLFKGVASITNDNDSEVTERIGVIFDNIGDAILEAVYVLTSKLLHLPNSSISELVDVIDLINSARG